MELGTGTTTGWRAGLAAGLLAASGCAMLPKCDTDAWEDAVGYVSVSAPHFVPVIAAAQGDRALAFGALRDEQKLADRVEQASVGMTYLLYEGWRAALQGKYAGPQLQLSETFKSSSSGTGKESLDPSGAITRVQERALSDAYDQESKRTFSSPEAPPRRGDETFLDTPEEVEERMFKLLDRSTRTWVLSPAERASLIAAYKTLMVSMEEYYNFSGFQFDGDLTSDYVPYRVHFTVTAEPGWYTRLNPYDAVVELTLGDKCDLDMKVLAVTPAETAQAIDQFQASIHKLQLALELEGTAQQAAARLQLDYIREVVERLEGLRNNNTLVVGFQGANKIRVRFRPLTVPTDERRDLQPTSRVLTAWVLVKNPEGEYLQDPTRTAVKSSLVMTDAEDPAGRRKDAEHELRQLKPRALAAIDAELSAANQQKTDKGLVQDEDARKDAPKEADEIARGIEELERVRVAVANLEVDDDLKIAAVTSALAPLRSGGTVRQQLEANLTSRLDAADRKATREKDAPGTMELLVRIANRRDLVGTMAETNRLLGGILRAADKRARAKDGEPERPQPQSCKVTVKAWFAAALEDDGRSWSPPRWPLRWFGLSDPVERLAPNAQPEAFEVAVPIWPGPETRPFEVVTTFGYYWGDFSGISALYKLLETEMAPLNKARDEHAKAVVVAKEAKAQHEQAKSEREAAQATLERLEKEGAPDAEVEAARKRLAAAKEKESKTEAAHAAQEKKVGELATRIQALDAQLKARRDEIQKALADRLSGGRAVVGFSIRSSTRVVLRENGVPDAHETAVWVRLTGGGEAAETAFVRVGKGDVGATLEMAKLDLSMSIPVLEPEKYAAGVAKDLRLFLEAVLVDEEAHKVIVDPVRGPIARSAGEVELPVFGRIVREVVVEPRARTSPVARAAADASKASEESKAATSAAGGTK